MYTTTVYIISIYASSMYAISVSIVVSTLVVCTLVVCTILVCSVLICTLVRCKFEKNFKFGAHINSYKNPANRNRTSDLEISVYNYYSLPLCQLSYSRIFIFLEYIYDYITICIRLNYIRNQVGFHVQKMSGPLVSFRKRYYKVSHEVEHPII